MKEVSYLNILIFCSVFSQGIAVVQHEEIDKSSDLQIRKKRVINHSPGGSQPAHITMSRHIVQVLVADNFECAGSILQANIIVTVRNCLYASDDMYTVLSGSLTKNRGTRHQVLKSTKHYDTNLALMKIYPPIHLSPRGSQSIALFTGNLPATGIFSGWGCTNISPTGERTYPEQLMSTILPILKPEECYGDIRAHLHHYAPHVDILCTSDPRRERGACYGDEGASLVYANRLIGIYSYNGGVNLGVHPDVYINLSSPNISRWIHFESIELVNHRGR